MEPLRSPATTSGSSAADMNPVSQRKRSRKSQPRKCLGASQSFRLNPEFDPKELANQNGQNNIKLDPKTIEFNELVQLLHPSYISDYLHNILTYLSSDSIELSFPNIAPYKATFLLKIVQNHEFLKCTEKFSESARVLAKQILDVVEVNKNVYRWTYSYENGATNALVYKKIYNFAKKSTNMQTTQRSVFKQPEALTNTSEALASSLEDLTLVTDEEIPSSFKLNTLNTMLKFVKDPNRTIFVFPELPLHEAEFVHGILNRNESVGFGYKSLYGMLFDSIEKLATVFNVETSYLTRGKSTAQVCVEKLPKRVATQANDSNHNMSIESSHSKDNQNLTKDNRYLPKDMQKKKEVLDNVQGDFIKNVLVAILEFIRDEQRGSLEFKKSCPNDSRFLESLTSFIRHQENHSLFPEECVPLLQRIKRTRCDDWKLQAVVGKACKKTKERCITFYKVPVTKNSEKEKTTISTTDKCNNNITVRISSGSTQRSVTKQPVNNHNPPATQKVSNVPQKVSKKVINVTPQKVSNNIPKQVTNVPPKVTNVPPNVTNVPPKVTHIPPKVSNVPPQKVSNVAPQKETNVIPQKVSNVPPKGTNVPPKGTNVPLNVTNVPPKVTNVPPKVINVPLKVTHIPPKVSNVPSQKVSNVSPKGTNVPPKVTNVPPNVTNVSPKVPSETLKETVSPSTRKVANEPKPTEKKEEAKIMKVGSQNESSANRSKSLDRGNSNTSTTGSAIPTVVTGGQRKNRLIEGLSKPIESDRGSRMMRLMGWEGGPLGQRGDGITEPIMPAIHLKPGAGLGHVKEVERRNITFQELFLKKVLELLETNFQLIPGVFVVCNYSLSKKDWQYIMKVLKAFNERHCEGLNFPNEAWPLVADVLKELTQENRLIIEAAISKDKRQIHLRKTFCSVPIIPGPKPEPISMDAPPKVKLTNAEKSIIKRVKILKTIEEFLLIQVPEKGYDVGVVLGKKMQAFISNVLKMANSRNANILLASYEEQLIFDGIFAKAKDYYLSFTVSYRRRLVLHKNYYPKRLPDSAINLPPPTSKDIKNTVIYNNTKENNNVQHSDNDDDVVIIERKQEIITISDSDDEKDGENLPHNVTSDTVELPKPNKDVLESPISNLVAKVNSTIISDNVSTVQSNLVQTVTNATTVSDVATLVENTKETTINTNDTNLVKNTNLNNEKDTQLITSKMNDKSSVAETTKDNNCNDMVTPEKTILEATHFPNISVLAKPDSDDMVKPVKTNTETLNVQEISDVATPDINNMLTPDKTDSETSNFQDLSDLVTPNTEDYIDCDNFSKDSLNTSDESILLDILEKENDSCDTNVIQMENGKQDITEEEVIANCIDGNKYTKEAVYTDIMDNVFNLKINNNEDCVDSKSSINIKFSNGQSLDYSDTSSSSSKRLRTNSNESTNSTKRYKTTSNFYLSITKTAGGIDLETVKRVQKIISKNIDDNSYKPLLKCHNIQNGGLIYGCHDEKCLKWLESIISIARDLKTTIVDFCENVTYKVFIKISSSDSVQKSLANISKYNEGLVTDNWVLKNVEFHEGYQVITVVIDEDSYNYISMYNFSLFAGVDMARFSLAWD